MHYHEESVLINGSFICLLYMDMKCDVKCEEWCQKLATFFGFVK